jgi:hypothetical protein
MSTVLKNYIREVLHENFQSHTFEPVLGDPIVNVNRNCKHFQSRGTVTDIKDLAGDAGKVVVYQVSNNGDTFSPGDVLEKTMDQLAPDEGIYEIKKFITGILNEGVEFRELDSPLTYSRAGNVKRLALCDTSVEGPNLSPSGKPMRDAYFNEYQEWDNYGVSGRRLKKPRKGQMVPGVSDACVVGFLDFHKYGDNGWYIDYMKTRGDKGGQGTASKLVDEFFKRYAKSGGMVHFGKMMRAEIGHLKDKMEKQYPDVTVIGAKNF